MGVYIKGMMMPKVCADCPFREIRYDPGYYNYEHCKALGKIFNEHSMELDPFEERFNDCPIQPIDDEQVEKLQRDLLRAWSVFRSVLKDENHDN